MKNELKWLVALALLLAVGIAQADPIKDNVLDSYKAGWYPNSSQNQLMTCPETCKVLVKGVAEHEATGVKNIETSVCKVAIRNVLDKRLLINNFLYGNQFASNPVCYTADTHGNLKKNRQFYCLCVAGTACDGPDLVVIKIDKPVWDNANHRSVITAEIKNIGSGAAAASIARVIDPSTAQSTSAPYNAIANTPALVAGASITVTFYLPYWVYNPDADLEVTADYKGMVQECDENNNTKTFHEIG